ncbi:MAG: hypothetical protein ABUL63_05085 [Acidobacteriota bacterium]
MTISRTILLACALLLPLGCAQSPAPRTAPGRPAPSALSVLQRQDRNAVWNEASQVIADLNRDGVDDYALRGLRKDRVVVGIVAGPVTARSRAWVLAFPWGKGTQSSLCSREAKIEPEELDEAATAGARPAAAPKKPKRPKGLKGKGISLYDDRCDAFHIYWSPEDRKFDWWRL